MPDQRHFLSLFSCSLTERRSNLRIQEEDNHSCGVFLDPFQICSDSLSWEEGGEGGRGRRKGIEGGEKEGRKGGEWKRGKGEEEEGDCVKVNKNVVQTLTFHS